MAYSNLYIHVPFCIRKCAYCAFYSETDASDGARSLWLEKTLSTLQANAGQLQDLHSIYLGGGTPTLLSMDMLEALFRGIRENTSLVQGGEVSIESNPETVTDEKAAFLSGHVNRVTLGAQSFMRKHLLSIGRSCTDPDKIFNAVDLYRAHGLTNIGLDLIYAIPHQMRAEFISDLDTAISLGVKHISCYSLTFEENAHLAPEADYDAHEFDAMWFDCGKHLAANGFPRYEISNYAQPSFESRHNSNIWHGETYLGIGPSATSFDGIDRFTQTASLSHWCADSAPETDSIPREQRLREMFVFGLRTSRGWAEGEFEQVSGVSEAMFSNEKARLREDGLMCDFRTALTEKGLAFWDSVAETIL